MKLHQLVEARMPATVKNKIDAKIKAVKRGEVNVTWRDLDKAEDAAWESGDDTEIKIASTVNSELRKWSAECREQYMKLIADVEKIEREEQRNHKGIYLVDQGVDNENVVDGGITENHVTYWGSMLNAGGSAMGQRASDYGIDINKRLGRVIF